MREYLEHSKFILTDKFSGYKPNRTGIDTISRFGYQNEYNLEEGFPLLTTKKTPIKAITHELIWFLHGDTNIKYLVDNNVHIWDGNAFQHYLRKNNLESKYLIYSPEWNEKRKEFIEKIKEDEEFAEENGNLGDVYGAQWRRWKTSDGKELDQIADVVDMFRNSPSSRRLIVSAWNPEKISDMALPPCHVLYQMNILDGKLDLGLYQRSCDMFLGVPFNIASYAMLTQVLAQQADLEQGRFIHSFGDAHFYCGADERGKFYGDNLETLKEKVANAGDLEEYLEIKEWIEENAPSETQGKERQDHVTGVLEQMSRKPFPLPKMEISNKPLDKLNIDDFKLINYESHPPIKRVMAV